MNPSHFILKGISDKDTHHLRHKILRPHQELNAMAYSQDGLEKSYHIGAFVEDRLVGIVSLYPEDQAGNISATEWRIRGMAVDFDFQKMGLGRQILEAAIHHARSQGARSVWCNARTSAIGFYLSYGFEKVGDEFIIDDIGPHYVAMFKLL